MKRSLTRSIRTRQTMMPSIRILGFPLFLSYLLVRAAGSTDDPILPMNFQDACTQGHLDLIRNELNAHPTWVNGRTPQGETCLHLAGITGQIEVTRLLLEMGADPNIRSTFERGQRMHPLSWNVYGGYVDTARLLLEHGADVNLDIDFIFTENSLATAYDVLLYILPAENKEHPDAAKYYAMKELLEEYGAMTYSDLQQASEL